MGISVEGLAPYLRPGGASWWCASGVREDGGLDLVRLDEGRPPPVAAACGLAAPCSLPRAFLAFLDGRAPSAREARRFARRQQRGRRHPRREGESTSALDRRRLALHLTALPLLRRTPTLPWTRPEPPFLFEVDPPALLKALGLPQARLGGERPGAVARRASILDALSEGVFGFPVRTRQRDFAVASRHALDAVLCAATAAWLQASRPRPPGADAEAWIPVP